ncbi:DUF4387 family protein [Micromonospora chokoriensis]
MVVDPGFLDASLIARLYGVRTDAIRTFRIPALNVVKVSFPRPVAQGSLRDRDIHAGQHHVPLAMLPLPESH